MSTTVVTTFSIDGYELYGKKMIDTWLKYWPNNISLTVYTEGYTLTENDSRLAALDINYCCPTLNKFKEESLKLIDPNNKKTKSRISKAIRWSHKVYAMSHALNNCNTKYLIFLDGDTYTKNTVPATLAESLVKNHLFAVHFEKIQGMLHFETGLICFNMNHPQIEILKRELQKGYDTMKIHSIHKPWDSFWLVYLYQTFNLDVLNLAINSYQVFGNPLIKNILVHDVGKEKFHNKNYDKYSGRKNNEIR